MCSFRNWFHFINTTEGSRPAQNTINVRDRLVYHTDRESPKTLRELGVLETLAHPCDRTYARTNYNSCRAPALVKTESDSVTAEEMLVIKTWLQKQEEW
jgi:hypothetical protein